ncbi:MAG: dicarboxylate transporter/tellurite-resistance protein TehA [Caulobacter sp.]|nr:dicarboxylate transporter/tellurite-resistance protein TehA [Caulobacter sp.]
MTMISTSVAAPPPRLPIVPAAFFSMVLGLGGLGGAWRTAHRLYGLPAWIGEAIMGLAVVVWAILLILFVAKWLLAREQALAEARHPIQCCFIALAGVATLLVAGALAPYSHGLGVVVFTAGVVFTMGFSLWRTGTLWRGERDPTTTTAVLYLPTVGGCFVTGTVSSALGAPDWGLLSFGAGFLAWLAMESVLLHRLLLAPEMAVPIRATMGVQLAPPAVGAVSLANVMPHGAELLGHMMIGYGLLQLGILARQALWIAKQPLSAAYWSFSFGVTALATAPLLMTLHGDAGPMAILAPWLFGLANISIGLLAMGTLVLLLQGRLLPPPAPSSPVRA